MRGAIRCSGTVALTPAVADPVPDTEEYPDVAFLARNDVPFDAQTAASMDAQLGAPMFITNPNTLADAARDGIADLNPDVIIVAGGVFAVSDEVAQAATEACDPDCTIDRRFGAGRDETAADLATIAADYGFDRPVLQGSNQVLGDVNIGGTANVDDLTIQDTEMVAGLNADRVDGMHASDFLDATEKAADSELLDGLDSSDLALASEPALTWHANGPTFTSALIDSGAEVTVASLTVEVPDPCGDGTTNTQIMVEGHGSVYLDDGDGAHAFAAARVNLDGTPATVTNDLGRRTPTLAWHKLNRRSMQTSWFRSKSSTTSIQVPTRSTSSPSVAAGTRGTRSSVLAISLSRGSRRPGRS